MKLLGRIICLLARKHRRGKFVRNIWKDDLLMHVVYACPRCGREKKYRNMNAEIRRKEAV